MRKRLKSPRVLSLVASGFFVVLFIIATVFHLLNGRYVQAVGFFLIGISNVPFLLSGRDRDLRVDSSRMATIVNVTAIIGLSLVVIGWLGWA
jgi:uncharacterized membrane protein